MNNNIDKKSVGNVENVFVILLNRFFALLANKIIDNNPSYINAFIERI